MKWVCLDDVYEPAAATSSLSTKISSKQLNSSVQPVPPSPAKRNQTSAHPDPGVEGGDRLMRGGVEDVDDDDDDGDDDDDDSLEGGFDEDLGWEQDQLNTNDTFPLISCLNLPIFGSTDQSTEGGGGGRISAAPIERAC